MAADGTPDFTTIRGGEGIARLRTARGLSRAKLIARLLDKLDPSDPNYDSISEAWLARLENGRMVKVSREVIEALCKALHCTKRDRAEVLQLYDRNVLNNNTEVAKLLNQTMDRLYTEAENILTSLLNQRRATDLDEQEMFELTAAALEIVIKSHDG